MGLTDIWHELQYFWIDLTGYTEAERRADTYRNVVEKLDRQIPQCEEWLDEVKQAGTELDGQFLVNANSAAGEMMDYFADKEDVWNTARTEVLTQMETALSTAKERRAEAQASMTYWETEIQTEETQLRNQLWNRKEEEQRRQEG